MGSRIRNGLAIASFLTCIAAALLWIRGYWAADSVAWLRPQLTPQTLTVSHDALASAQGQFILRLTQEHYNMDLFQPDAWRTLAPDAQARLARFRDSRLACGGWYLQTFPLPEASPAELAWRSLADFECLPLPPETGRRIVFPAWLLVALTALSPLHWLARRRRNGRPVSAGPVAPALA